MRFFVFFRHIRISLKCFSLFCVCSIGTILTSCGTQQEFAYIADAVRDSSAIIENTYAATIHPGDHLYIYVSSQTPESVIPFNEETNKIVTSIAGTRYAARKTLKNATQNNVDGYFVDDNGYILFPVIGKIHAAGLTYEELARNIQHHLIVEGYVTDPLVAVKLINFRVAVIGEVKWPQELHEEGGRLTIFEALAKCGDLTIYAIRDSIGVLRDDNGVLTLGYIDVTSKDIFDSPYYYLQSNDIVYVEPNKKRKRQAYDDATTVQDITSYVRLGWSAVSLARSIYIRYYIRRVQDELKR